MTTDDEQDILRAMVVMAAAGLDSMTKQLVRDTLGMVIKVNEQSQDGLQKHIARQFASDVELVSEGKTAQFIAKLLASPDLPAKAVQEYVRHLTSGSLQSADELLKIAGAFGITREAMPTDFESLRAVFKVRNKIIHELDINLEAHGRKRNIRSQELMVKHANALLAAGQDLLTAVNIELTDHQVP